MADREDAFESCYREGKAWSNCRKGSFAEGGVGDCRGPNRLKHVICLLIFYYLFLNFAIFLPFTLLALITFIKDKRIVINSDMFAKPL